MKKLLFCCSFVAHFSCIAQTHKLQIGVDATLHSWRDYFALMYFASYTYQITDFIGVQAEYHSTSKTDFSGGSTVEVYQNGVLVKSFPSSQVGGQATAFPEVKVPQLGYQALEFNNESMSYSTIDLTALFNIVKNSKNEFSFGLGGSRTAADRNYVPELVTGTFTSPPTGTRDLLLAIPVYQRFLALGFNAKLAYSYNFSDRIAIGARLTYHSFFNTKNTYYVSTGLNFQVKF